MGASFSLDGGAELRAALGRAGDVAPLAGRAALYGQATRILMDSVPLVPWDNGILRGSAHVVAPTVNGGVITVEFGYGGAASAYAWYQHEEDLQHPNGGQRYYLRDAVQMHEATFEAQMAQRVRAFLGRGLR